MKRNIRSVSFKKSELHIMEYLDLQPNCAEYIKDLILKDMNVNYEKSLIDKMEELFKRYSINIQEKPVSNDKAKVNIDKSKLDKIFKI